MSSNGIKKTVRYTEPQTDSVVDVDIGTGVITVEFGSDTTEFYVSGRLDAASTLISLRDMFSAAAHDLAIAPLEELNKIEE